MKKGEQCLTACHGVDAMQEQMEYNSYLLDLPELKALRHNDYSKEELMKMLKDKMTKEELLGLLLGKCHFIFLGFNQKVSFEKNKTRFRYKK